MRQLSEEYMELAVPLDTLLMITIQIGNETVIAVEENSIKIVDLVRVILSYYKNRQATIEVLENGYREKRS